MPPPITGDDKPAHCVSDIGDGEYVLNGEHDARKNQPMKSRMVWKSKTSLKLRSARDETHSIPKVHNRHGETDAACEEGEFRGA